MNIKLLAVASVAISLSAVAGCLVQPSNTLGGGGAGGDSLGQGPGAGPGGPGSGPASSGAGTGETDARKFYVSDVHPLLVNMADAAHSCTGCHVSGASNAPMFMDADAEKSYDKMDAYTGLIVAPENSQLLLHGVHTGPAMTQTQKDTVTHWLTQEAMARAGGASTSTSTSTSGSGGGGPVMTLEQWLLQVGKCMDIGDWKANNLDLLAKTQTFNQGSCGACHSLGEGGNYLDTLDPTTTFTKQQMSPYVKRWFKPAYVGGDVSGMVANPRNSLKSVELAMTPCVQKPGLICHPSYQLPPTLKTGIDTFISATLARMTAKTCAP